MNIASEGDAHSDEDGIEPVLTLAVWKGRLISGHWSEKLRVWNVVTDECDEVLGKSR